MGHRSSNLYRFIALAALLCLAPLGSCAGPDLEPPFSGTSRPEAPGSAPGVGTAGRSADAADSGQGTAAPRGGAKASAGSGGAAGSRNADAGTAMEDAGAEP